MFNYYLLNICVQSQDLIFDTVPVRVYIPKNRSSNGPAMIFFHGGGWAIGDVGKLLILTRNTIKRAITVKFYIKFTSI